MCENESWCQSTIMNEDDVYTKIKFIYFDDYENSSISFTYLKRISALSCETSMLIYLLYNQFINYFGIISIGTPSWDFKAKKRKHYSWVERLTLAVQILEYLNFWCVHICFQSLSCQSKSLIKDPCLQLSTHKWHKKETLRNWLIYWFTLYWQTVALVTVI